MTERFHYLIFFSKTGKAAFLSHLDSMRIIERAVRRSGLDTLFTEGCNPRIKLSFSRALPVGLSYRNEPMVLRFRREYDVKEIERAVNDQLPSGFCVEKVVKDGELTYSESAETEREMVFTVAYTGTPEQAAAAFRPWSKNGLEIPGGHNRPGPNKNDRYPSQIEVFPEQARIRIKPIEGVFPKMKDLLRALYSVSDQVEASFEINEITRC